MLRSDTDLLKSFLVSVCSEVFAGYGLVLELQSDERTFNGSPSQVGTFIGFFGPTLRGTLTIFAPTSFMRATYPLRAADGTVGDLQLLDWSSEIANQLLGRLKNKLVGRGMELEMSLPKTLLAAGVFVATGGPKSVCALTFTNGVDEMGVFLDAAPIDQGSIFRTFHPSRACLPEGDLMIF
jgi:hypothetical protein